MSDMLFYIISDKIGQLKWNGGLLVVGKGPFPGLIDLFGTAGGLNDFRAALLASRGFAAFSLAFFGYEDLPKALNFDLEYMDVSTCSLIQRYIKRYKSEFYENQNVGE